MSGDGTVEWGGDRPVRLLDRLFGDGGDGGGGGGVRRLSAPAIGAAIVATALFAVAELLPWMSTTQLTASFSTAPTMETRELSLDLIGGGLATAYYVGLLVLLAVVGLVQVSRPHARRVLVAAGIGVAAGMLVLLVGAVRRAGEGGEMTFLQGNESAPGPGPYVAIAAVVVAVAALVLSGWHPSVPGRRPMAENQVDDDDEDGEEPGPIDLTVTPA